MTILRFLSIIYVYYVALVVMVSGTECTFCRQNHTAITLAPYVSVEDYGLQQSHSIADLLPLIQLVSKEFKSIVVPLDHVMMYETAPSLFNLPLAVAQWNNKTFSTQNMSHVDAWLLIKPSHSKKRLFPGLRNIRELADKANLMHPKSVTSVIILPPDLAIQKANFIDFLSEVRNIFPQLLYKLGLSIHVNDLEKLNNHGIIEQINLNFTKFLDLIVFQFDDASTDSRLSQPVKVILKEKLISFRSVCASVKDYTLKTKNSSIPVMIQISWPDTSNDGKINYRRSVEFWETMGDLAKNENISVNFVSAFDQHKYSSETSGWWRLVEKSEYTSSSQYVFETKMEIAKREEEITTSSLISRLKNPVEFDRARISTEFFAHFMPYQSFWSDRSYMKLMIEQIGSKFSEIFVNYNYISRLNADERATLIDLVANYNLISEKPLQLMLSIYNNRINPDMDSLIDLIHVKNYIYPGLIAKVMLEQQVVSHRINETLLKYVRNKLNLESSQKTIRVGVVLPMASCYLDVDTFMLDSQIMMILSNVDFVYFANIFPLNVVGYRIGVDRILPQLCCMFENCKRRVAQFFPELEIGFETGYPDSYLYEYEDYKSLAIFWIELNAWAQKTNTSVLFYMAVDLSMFYFGGVSYTSHMGWWYVRPGSNPYAFEEKRVVALKQLESLLPPTDIDWTMTYISVGVIVSITIMAGTLFSLYKWRKIKQDKVKKEVNHSDELDLQGRDSVAILPSADFLPASSTLIGAGNYGLVYKCFMVHFQREVAVKMARPSNYDNCHDNLVCDGTTLAGVNNLLAEIKIMSHVGNHQNILQLLGVSPKGTLFMVTEYCENGSLLSYLRSLATYEEVPFYNELLQFCWEIANGMEFLANMDVIHGDLSARNVLLNEDKTCKISDFGLSRKLENYEKYKKKGKDPLPWRWMSYESLTDLEFSLKSDVWSMGVTFWEIFTLGKPPFPGMTWDNTFCDKLADGLRLAKPKYSTENIYNILLSCWSIDIQDRPSAPGILESLEKIKGTDYTILY